MTQSSLWSARQDTPAEQAGGSALCRAGTDVYALGVVLYPIDAGQLPFQHDSALELHEP